MEVIEAIYKRRAIRSYTDGPVNRETIPQVASGSGSCAERH